MPLHVVAVDGDVVGRREEGHDDEDSDEQGVRQVGDQPHAVTQAEGGQESRQQGDESLDQDHPGAPGGIDVHQGRPQELQVPR
jgi:hypothetical protein